MMMIEKILSKIENLIMCNSEEAEACYPSAIAREYAYYECKEIVQEVAKEYDWVSVKERLPEPFQRVLVYDAWDDSMTIEHLQENDSFIDSVVAWMPLPIAPYQKGE